MRKQFVLLMFALMIPAASQAAIITFTGPIGTPVASTAEGVYTYSTFSGGLFRDSQGNGDSFNMEGCSSCGGGVLRVVRNDVAGGLFTFNGADVAFQFNTVAPITFRGYLSSVLVGTDIFNTALGSVYTSHLSNLLSGVAIDELRVQLNATSNSATVVDNINVTASAIPEPATLALVGLALAGLAFRRRTKRDR